MTNHKLNQLKEAIVKETERCILLTTLQEEIENLLRQNRQIKREVIWQYSDYEEHFDDDLLDIITFSCNDNEELSVHVWGNINKRYTLSNFVKEHVL